MFDTFLTRSCKLQVSHASQLNCIKHPCFYFIDKLREEKVNVQKKKNLVSAKTTVRFMIILALLCQHFDFDKRRTEMPGKIHQQAIISKSIGHTYCIIAFYNLITIFFFTDKLADLDIVHKVRCHITQ